MLKFIKILLISLFFFLLTDFFFGKKILKIIKIKLKVNSSVAIKNDEQFYIFKNNENKNLVWGDQIYNFCTNSIGLKASCKKKNKIKKKYSYAFIGDSFTEGIGIEYEDTFVGLFNKNNDTINLGISGHSPYLYLKRLKFYNKKILFDNLILFLDLTDFEDDYGWSQKGLKYIEYHNINLKTDKFKRFLNDNFIVTYTLLKTAWWKFYLANISMNEVYKKDDIRWSWEYFQKTKIPNYLEKKKLYQENIINIINYCKKNNIKLFIVTYPQPGTLLYLKTPLESKQNKIINNLCNKYGCKNYSLYQKFFNELKKTSAEITIKNYYINYDIHFNKKGNAFIYEFLKEKFKR